MTRRSKLFWWAGAALFVFINVAGAGYAAILGEGLHATTHVVLLVLGGGGYLVWRRASRTRQQNLPAAAQADARVEYLQQSVDAMALELERLGEAQRYREKLQVARGETPPLIKDQ